MHTVYILSAGKTVSALLLEYISGTLEANYCLAQELQEYLYKKGLYEP